MPPQIWVTTFDDYAMPLYVPAGCKSKYAEAEYWNNFTDIRETGVVLVHGYGQCHRRDDGICDRRWRVSAGKHGDPCRHTFRAKLFRAMERWQYRQSPHDNGHGRHDIHRRVRAGRLRRGNIGKRGERHLCDWPHLACGERRGILPGVHRRRPVGLYGQRQQRDAICPRYVYRAHGRPLAESGGKITVPVLPFFRQGGGGISAAFSLTPSSRSIYHLFLF